MSRIELPLGLMAAALPFALASSWVVSANGRLAAAEASPEVQQAVAVAQADERGYCSPELKAVLRRVLTRSLSALHTPVPRPARNAALRLSTASTTRWLPPLLLPVALPLVARPTPSPSPGCTPGASSSTTRKPQPTFALARSRCSGAPTAT